MTSIVCMSDTHTLQEKVPMPEGNFDIFIHAGDLGNVGKIREYADIGKWFYSLKKQFKHRIIVPGNHDWGLMTNPQMIMEDYFDEDVILLIDKAIELEGIKFYGCPWMPNFMDWAYMLEENKLEPYYAAIPEDTQVLITHCPPLDILDKTTEKYGYARCGSVNLAKRIKQLSRLTHHIFGHIHHSYGSIVIDGVSYHNVSNLNEGYRYQNPPQVIEL